MNTNAIRVEDDDADDAAAVETLLDPSFGLSRQTKTSYRLREGNTPIAGLSLVVRDAEFGLSGTISFWPLKIGEAGSDALLLGPLAVHPARQNLGIGLALMREGLAQGEAARAPACSAGRRCALLCAGRFREGAGRPARCCRARSIRQRLLYLELEAGRAWPKRRAWSCRPIVSRRVTCAAMPTVSPNAKRCRSAAFAAPHGADREQATARGSPASRRGRFRAMTARGRRRSP